MIVAVDVDYERRTPAGQHEVVAAAVGFSSWTAAQPTAEVIVASDAPAAPYEPGQFYKRELPHLVAVLALMPPPLQAVVVDGYVWLEPGTHGLGAHLYDALGATTPVIGVAKTRYASASAIEVLRGGSARPLLITAVGIDANEAAAHVRSMAGDHRVPALLRRVDQLCRAG